VLQYKDQVVSNRRYNVIRNTQAHCVGRMLKLHKVGTLCGQNAEVAKREAHHVGRMLKLQKVDTLCGQNAEVAKGGHTVWAKC